MKLEIFTRNLSLLKLCLIDGTSPGDGTSIGKCPSSYSTYKCLSTGECNVCGLISGKAQGCDITSTSPVCDADSSTPGTQDTATGKVAQCTSCTKSGKEYHSMHKYQINRVLNSKCHTRCYHI